MEKQEVNFDFTGKNYVVVGASSGMGRQVAIELAEAGANVLAIARNEERLNQLKYKCSNIHIQILDVTQAGKDDWLKIFDEYVKMHGKIDGGVYTAGTTAITSLKFYDKKQAEEIMDSGFWGVLYWFQAISKKRVSKNNAAFVVFSSVAAYDSPKGLIVYSGVKSAIQASIKSIVKEIAPRYQRLNTVSPAWVDTEMTQKYLSNIANTINNTHNGYLGMGRPQDVSGIVLFLLSDRASWITGQDFVVDGGYMSGAWN